MADPTDPARVQFLFDFGSPNAWMCHQLIPAIEARTKARFDYVPILLGGLFKLANNRSPMEAFRDIPNKLAYERLERQLFVDAHGLSRFRMNPFFPVNTLKLMRLAVAAQAAGVGRACIDAMYAAMWEQQRNMDDDGEIATVLGVAGLDAPALLGAAQTPTVKAALIANTQAAFDRGAFGSPTFFVGGEMYFGKDRLRDVEAALAVPGAVSVRRTSDPPRA